MIKDIIVLKTDDTSWIGSCIFYICMSHLNTGVDL